MADWTAALPNYKESGSMYFLPLDLLKKGYLTFYWRSADGFPDETMLKQLAEGNSEDDEASIRFPAVKPGDRVAAMLSEDSVAIVEITGDAHPMSDLPEEVAHEAFQDCRREIFDPSANMFEFDGTGFCRQLGKGRKSYLNLGYFRTARILKGPMALRDLAPELRRAFDVVFYTFTQLEGSELIDAGLTSRERIPLDELVRSEIGPVLLGALREYLWWDEVEDLCAWYMERLGADVSVKNSILLLEGGARLVCYVMAVFEELKLVVYIPSYWEEEGHYSAPTVSEGIKKAAELRDSLERDPMADPALEEYSQSAWFLSLEDVTDEDRKAAKELGVRLVGGSEFANDILGRGLSGIGRVSPVGDYVDEVKELFDN